MYIRSKVHVFSKTLFILDHKNKLRDHITKILEEDHSLIYNTAERGVFVFFFALGQVDMEKIQGKERCVVLYEWSLEYCTGAI